MNKTIITAAAILAFAGTSLFAAEAKVPATSTAKAQETVAAPAKAVHAKAKAKVRKAKVNKAAVPAATPTVAAVK